LTILHRSPSLALQRIHASPPLTPFIKWPGGKSHELAAIAAAAPSFTGRLIDPFVGGGSVLLAADPAISAWANDACADLARLYEVAARSKGSFLAALVGVADAWDGFQGLGELVGVLAGAFRREDGEAVAATLRDREWQFRQALEPAGPQLPDLYRRIVQRDLPTKLERMRSIQTRLGVELSAADLLANIEGALRAAMYMAIRSRYNHARREGRWEPFRSADFLFLREFSYAAMFRFNSRGDFNVPYGGVTYNRKSLNDKVRLLSSSAMRERLAATEWRCMDFEPFLAEASPNSDDFVFVDPPYDSAFSAYDDMPFTVVDQERLQRTLADLPSAVMVVIKDTPDIRHIYAGDRWRISAAPKTYMWTIKSRNDRAATHLTITNYAQARSPGPRPPPA